MGTISPSTFDPLKARVNVRLQQGIPVVDSDLNELDDIRKFELRAFLRWFVGDGVPDGSDAFRIDAVGAADDLAIRAGVPPAPSGSSSLAVALRGAGRCLVDGLDVVITADVTYKQQPLYGASGADAIAAIPVVDGPVLVYLDVWERLVTPQQDPTMVLSGLGETCARVRREWAVRAVAGATLPASTDTHAYCALARVNRKLVGPGQPAVITAADVVDLRQRHLTLAALESRVARLERTLLFPVFAAPGQQVEPSSAMVGSVVTLHGRNFDIGAPRVKIGNVAAALHGTPTATEVRAVVPNLAVGPQAVSITTDGGGPVTADDAFSVQGGSAAPTITGLAGITSAGAGEVAQFQINGTNLADALEVTFAGSGVDGTISAASANLLTVQASVTGGAARGDRAVTVTTPAGSITGGAFKVLARPSISTIAVTGVSGNVATVDINGSNLAFQPVAVAVNDAALSVAITATTATKITVRVTIGVGAPTGTKTFTVTTADGTASGSVTITQPCPSQGQPAVPCSGQGNPGVPCTTQGQPGVPCTSQGQPGVPCTTQGQPGVPCTSQGQPGVPCTSQGQPGVPCTSQGQPSVPCTSQGQPGVPCTSQGHPGVPCTGQGNPGNPCTGQGNPDNPCTGAGNPDNPCTGVGRPDNPCAQANKPLIP